MKPDTENKEVKVIKMDAGTEEERLIEWVLKNTKSF